MDASFIPIETVPSKTPFGLDSLRRSYKTALSAEDAIAAAPAVGDPDESFPNMFLMPITTPESAESATRIDLVYIGSLQGAEGSPVLPDQKHEFEDAVQSASSSKSNAGVTLTSPASAQYYAPSAVLTYFSFEGPGTTLVDDPEGAIRVITLTVGDTTYSLGTSIQAWIDALFVEQITSTFQSAEVVPGKYWLNSSRKTKGLFPWIFEIVSGAYITIIASGNDYTVGNSISISSGGESATIEVTEVTPVNQSIVNFSVTSTDFTASHQTLTATGGSGAGAKFSVFYIP